MILQGPATESTQHYDSIMSVMPVEMCLGHGQHDTIQSGRAASISREESLGCDITDLHTMPCKRGKAVKRNEPGAMGAACADKRQGCRPLIALGGFDAGTQGQCGRG